MFAPDEVHRDLMRIKDNYEDVLVEAWKHMPHLTPKKKDELLRMHRKYPTSDSIDGLLAEALWNDKTMSMPLVIRGQVPERAVIYEGVITLPYTSSYSEFEEEAKKLLNTHGLDMVRDKFEMSYIPAHTGGYRTPKISWEIIDEDLIPSRLPVGYYLCAPIGYPIWNNRQYAVAIYPEVTFDEKVTFDKEVKFD